MSEKNSLTRREFTLEAALAILAGVNISISGCSSNSSTPTSPSSTPTPQSPSPSPSPPPSPPPSPSPSPSPPPTPSPATDLTGTISANHGHTATILAAQLTAGNAISLDIRGQARHSHTVTITQAEMGQIAANQQVSKNSTTDDGHRHVVTFN